MCRPRVVYLDVNISCSRTMFAGEMNCFTQSVRPSQNHTHLCPTITEIDLLNGTGYEPLNYMLRSLWNPEFAGAAPQGGALPSIAERYLENPSNVLKSVSALANALFPLDMTQIPSDIFANRLTMIWNTWSMATKNNGLLTGFQYRESPYFHFRFQGIFCVVFEELLNSQTTSWEFPVKDIYSINHHWLITFFYASCLLNLISITSFVIEMALRIPQVMGNISSFTYEQPYAGLSPKFAGSTLSSKRRAKLLEHFWVKLEDVQAQDGTQRLAVRLYRDRSEAKGLIRLDREYE
jgi:hypothetical protein